MKTRICCDHVVAVFILFALGAMLSACTTSARESQARDSETVVREVLELINERNLDDAFAMYALDYIYHGPGGQELRGRGAIRGLWEVFLAGFPDLSASVDDVIVQGDKLVLRWRVAGTHTGEFLGVAPTGKEVSLGITEIFRIADGQLAEAWDQYDRLDLMQQIGAYADD